MPDKNDRVPGTIVVILCALYFAAGVGIGYGIWGV